MGIPCGGIGIPIEGVGIPGIILGGGIGIPGIGGIPGGGTPIAGGGIGIPTGGGGKPAAGLLLRRFSFGA